DRRARGDEAGLRRLLVRARALLVREGPVPRVPRGSLRRAPQTALPVLLQSPLLVVRAQPGSKELLPLVGRQAPAVRQELRPPRADLPVQRTPERPKALCLRLRHRDPHRAALSALPGAPRGRALLRGRCGRT